jgi:hypothetical protein
MVTYQTCLPVKLLNYNGNPHIYGSLSVRVHVVPQPIYMIGEDRGIGKCSNVRNYTLITTPKRPADIFGQASANTVVQFRDGLGDDLFPSGVSENMVPMSSPDVVSQFADVLHLIEFLVPEAFIGKTVNEIASAAAAAAVVKKKKAYKCYVIDPKRDIVNDQILVDPTTGQSLSDTMKQEAFEEAGGDPALLGLEAGGSSGLMPGDIQEIIFIVVTTICTLVLLAYLGYITKLFITDKNFNGAMTNLLIFGVLLIALIVFGVMFGDDKPVPPSTEVLNVKHLG